MPKGSLRIEGQTLKTFDDVGESGLPVLRRFCGNCGSPIMTDVEAMQIAAAAAIYRAVQAVPCRDWRDALALTDAILRRVIEALRRDPAIPARSSEDWHLFFACTHGRIVEELSKVIDGHAALDAVLVTIDSVT